MKIKKEVASKKKKKKAASESYAICSALQTF